MPDVEEIMTVEQTIQAWVTRTDMFIVQCWPWLLAILIICLCWIAAMIWIGCRR